MSKLFIIIFILVGCSAPQVGDRSMESVGINSSTEKLAPEIERDLNQIQVSTIGQVADKVVSSKTEIILIDIGPGLEYSIGFVPILQEIVRKKVRVHYITGHGLGAVIAGMFASGISESRMEWAFYKFNNKKSGHSSFSNKWHRLVKKYLFKGLRGKRSENLNVGLLIPFYDEESTYQVRGELTDLLASHLRTFSGIDFEEQDHLVRTPSEVTLHISLRLEEVNELEDEIQELDNGQTKITFKIPVKHSPDGKKHLPAYLQRCRLRAKEIFNRIRPLISDEQKKEQRVDR